jgi:hypothetical protein
MKLYVSIVVLLSCVLVAGFAKASGDSKTTPSSATLDYLADGRVALPKNYRDWAYVSSGVDMNYSDPSMAMNHHMFDNVFVDPAALRAFRKTGLWPDGTVFAREDREGQTKGSINKSGVYQSEPVDGVELHVKDSVRFKGGWAFFAYGDDKPTAPIPANASCYACHGAHGAVDTTFVQFYPTLIGIARAKDTLSASYVLESKADPNGVTATPEP